MNFGMRALGGWIQDGRPVWFVGSGIGHRENPLWRLMGDTVELQWSYVEANLGKLLQDDGEITFGRGQDWMDFLTVVESWVGYTW